MKLLKFCGWFLASFSERFQEFEWLSIYGKHILSKWDKRSYGISSSSFGVLLFDSKGKVYRKHITRSGSRAEFSSLCVFSKILPFSHTISRQISIGCLWPRPLPFVDLGKDNETRRGHFSLSFFLFHKRILRNFWRIIFSVKIRFEGKRESDWNGFRWIWILGQNKDETWLEGRGERNQDFQGISYILKDRISQIWSDFWEDKIGEI